MNGWRIGMLAMLAAAPLMQASAALRATNDSQAQFDDGLFVLPALKNPKDAYLIIVTPKGEGEPLKFALPAGSHGLRVSTGALPTGAWTWIYKLAAEATPAIELKTPKEITLDSRRLAEGRFPLTWVPIAGADRYVITGQQRTKVNSDDEPDWEKLEAACLAVVCARSGVGVKGIDLKPGSEVKWQVSAQDADGIVIAKSAEAHLQVEVANSWIQAASKAGLKLQRSDTLSKLTATQPATFTYLSTQKDAPARSTAYQAEFALIYEGAEPVVGVWPRVSLEGRLTSAGEQKTSDALKLRGGGYKMIWAGRAGEGTELVGNLKYETERKSGTKKGLLELGLTPIYGPLGRYWPGPPASGEADAAGNYTRLPAVQLAPVISIGAELGKTMDAGTSQERKDTLLRLRTTLRLDAELNWLSYAVGSRGVSAYVEGTYWHLPQEDDARNFRLGKTGLTIALTDVVSFDLAYSVGREAPTFKFARSGSVGFGVKF